MPSLKYSLIVASYNRLPELKELIETIKFIDFPTEEFELVVSDDGSTDGTSEFMKNTEFPFQVQYISQENKGPAEARNHGMREAKGTYFIFTDSDCLLPKDYFRKVDAAIESRKLDAFGGPDDCHPSFPPFLKAINYALTSFIGTGGTRGKSNSITRFYPRTFNMGMHRKIYEKIGGMSQLRRAEDLDYAIRIYNAGFSVGLIQDAVVYHKRRANLRKFYKQIYNWGIGRINLGRMYSEMLKPIHLVPAVLLLVLLVTIGLSFYQPVFQSLLIVEAIGAGAIAVFAFFQSFGRYRSLHVSLLSVLVLFVQVFAYAMGTWKGVWYWVIGKKTSEG